ncbi:MAG: HlyD family efflux transporter periplasmic adaptor subunit [Polyangiaceae bacterium]|nr:HlyD family efflux transporter periplasmic adaptor subunit [Polyangiaceae bacterium]
MASKDHKVGAVYRVPAVSDLRLVRFVRTSRAPRTFARLISGAFVLLVFALIVVPWQQNAPGKGRVIAFSATQRQQTVDAPVEGRIGKWFVQEGQRVTEGQSLVDITDNDPEIVARIERERTAVLERIEAAKARTASLAGRIDALESSRTSGVAAADARSRMAKERLRAAEQALTSAEATAQTAGIQVERVRKLFEEGLQSKRAVELAELDAFKTKIDVDRARAARDAARAEQSALLQDLGKIGNDANASINDAQASRATALAEIANAEAELARLDVRLARQKTQAVTAPRDGWLFRILAQQGGQFVKSGAPLAIIIPHTDERAVEMWVDGNDVNLINEGERVRLQFEGWPAVQFSGWPSLAVGTYAGRVSFLDAADDGSGKFRIVVTPDPNEPAWPSGENLRQGMRANGWVLLNVVPLGYEAWRQFNGFPPDYPPNKDSKSSASGSKKEGGK